MDMKNAKVSGSLWRIKYRQNCRSRYRGDSIATLLWCFYLKGEGVEEVSIYF
ncbi:MAG: hypothetical protein IKX31_03645 [Muribaculaceae bacterium]|nr:hypothetical protein [Muribaculaceae bacterium]